MMFRRCHSKWYALLDFYMYDKFILLEITQLKDTLGCSQILFQLEKWLIVLYFVFIQIHSSFGNFFIERGHRF